MATTTTTSKNAAKKRRQRENRAANSLTSGAIVNPPIIISPNASATTATITNDPEHPDKEIEDLWRLAAQRAARKAWQRNYVEKQARLKAAATPQPPGNLWTDLCQEAENNYLKQQLRTAPIAVYTIVEPTAATTIPPTTQTDAATVPAWLADDDCDTVAKVKARLLGMEQNWAES